MFINLLVSPTALLIRDVLAIVAVIVMALSALASIVLILLQQGNSTGINALGGSSETFFGKNKGKTLESKMKKWTIICLVILLVFSVFYFVVPYNTAIWGAWLLSAKTNTGGLNTSRLFFSHRQGILYSKPKLTRLLRFRNFDLWTFDNNCYKPLKKAT